MSEIEDAVSDVQSQLVDDVDVDDEKIRNQLSTLVNEYQVPVEEAKRSVMNSIAEDEGADVSDLQGGGNDEKLVNELEEDENWIDVEVKVTTLWEPRSDSVSQVGLVGDESGENKFVSFETSDLPDLEEGKSYRLENVVTDEFESDISLKLNRTTDITELDYDVEVGDDSVEVQGPLVDIQSPSGLIKRCPNEGCTYVLREGNCKQHGDVDGFDFDLRIKGVIDTGYDTVDINMGREATEEFTGITLDEAETMGKDALDITVVADEMRKENIGTFLTINGPDLGDVVLVDTFEIGMDVPSESDLRERVEQLRN